MIKKLIAFGIVFALGIFFGMFLSNDEVAFPEKFIETGNKYYPDMAWMDCPQEMKVDGYAYPDNIQRVNGEGVTIKRTYTSEIAATGSMLPSLTKGNSLVTQPYDERELEVGMIVITDKVYTSENDKSSSGIVHRVVQVKEDSIITKGDNNNKCEEFQKDQVKYLVRGVVF